MVVFDQKFLVVWYVGPSDPIIVMVVGLLSTLYNAGNVPELMSIWSRWLAI